MKTLLVFLLSALTAMAAFQPDLRPGLDITGKTNVTASQLIQMVSFAQPGTNKGFIIRTNNLPDITTYPRYTNYIWVDISTSGGPAMKVYYGNGVDNSSTNWIASAVGAGSVISSSIETNAVQSYHIMTNAIQTYHIANNAVDANKIAALSINNSHLNAGIVSNANIATRSIEGGYNGKIALGTITHTNIGDGEITTSKIADGAVTLGKLAANAIYTNSIVGGITSNQFLMTGPTSTNAQWRSYISYSASSAVAVPVASDTNTHAHGFSGVPTFVRWVLVNTTPDLGYAAGMEVDINGVVNGLSNPISAQYADTTNIYLASAGGAVWYLRERDGTVTNAITKGSWQVKGYATRINP